MQSVCKLLCAAATLTAADPGKQRASSLLPSLLRHQTVLFTAVFSHSMAAFRLSPENVQCYVAATESVLSQTEFRTVTCLSLSALLNVCLHIWTTATLKQWPTAACGNWSCSPQFQRLLLQCLWNIGQSVSLGLLWDNHETTAGGGTECSWVPRENHPPFSFDLC